MSDVHPALLAEFPEEFGACQALQDFARANRPMKAPIHGAAGDLLMRTYARGSKTYQAVLRLAAAGYGEQAGMLNRSLFEDMVVTHWIMRNPKKAPAKLDRHRLHTLEKWRQAIHKHGRLEDAGELPPVPPDGTMRVIREEFAGKQHWTGRSLDEVLKEIEDEWPSEADRGLLWQIYDFTHFFSNLLLHHSYFGVAAAGRITGDTTTFDVGPSNMHIKGALTGAFFSYSNLASVVLDGEALEALHNLYGKHIGAFAKLRPAK